MRGKTGLDKDQDEVGEEVYREAIVAGKLLSLALYLTLVLLERTKG